MKRKIFTNRNAVLFMLLLFLGSVVGGAIESGIGREQPKLPESNIIRNLMTEGQKYAILSQGFLLLQYTMPSDCDMFCQTETSRIEGVVAKYSPYVFLEEIKDGTKMKLVASTFDGERDIDTVNVTSVENTICIALPLHPECRRQRALVAIQPPEGNETINVSLIG